MWQHEIDRISRLETEGLELSAQGQEHAETRTSSSSLSFRLKGFLKPNLSSQSKISAFSVHLYPAKASHAGRTLSFRATGPEACSDWVDELRDAIAAAKRVSTKVSRLRRIQVLPRHKHTQTKLVIVNGVNHDGPMVKHQNVVKHELLSQRERSQQQ